MEKKKKAIILLSGGLDSTVVLAMALAKGRLCYSISFQYGQKHRQELDAAKNIASYYGISHQIIQLDPSAFATSSLVSEKCVPQGRSMEEMARGGIPSTYVPARNTIFLAYALSQCELHGADEIHFGPNRLDAPCYPDCRPAYLNAFQTLINLATKQAVTQAAPLLVTPLIDLDKREIIQKGIELKAPLEMTWSCYSPTSEQKPCLQCDACILRRDGFASALA